MKYSSTAYQSSVALYREGPVSEVSELLPIGRPGRPEAHGEASPTVGTDAGVAACERTDSKHGLHVCTGGRAEPPR